MSQNSDNFFESSDFDDVLYNAAALYEESMQVSAEVFLKFHLFIIFLYLYIYIYIAINMLRL